MAGHSKWANIQHRKNAQDARRGKVFTRLIREIHVAARMGGADPEANPRLRLAIDKALGNNVPKDNVERAIKRATGADDDYGPLEEVRYEGYGPGGAAVMVECMTDNRNRTASAVRHAFTKHGGKLGVDGSVAFLFESKGVLSYPPGTDEDALMAAAVEAGAEDVVADDDGSLEVLTAPEEFVSVRSAMAAAGLTPERAEVTQRATAGTHLEADDAQGMLRLFDALEDIDDVQNVYSNADIDAQVVERL